MTSSSRRPIASLLFMPATSEKFIVKARALDIDAVVLDLEDAVGPNEKDKARQGLEQALVSFSGAKAQCFVRVNGPLTPWFHADLLAVRGLGIDGLVIPKVESPRDLEIALALAGWNDRRAGTIIAGIETLPGVTELHSILSGKNVDALYYGSEDLSADLGLAPSTAPNLTMMRAQVALLARRFDALAIDQGVADVRNHDNFRNDAQAGKALGYTGKICLTPAQAEVAQAVFRPSEADLAWAREVLDTFERALATGHGVGLVGSMFVDEAAARRARRILASAGVAELR